MGTWRPSEGRWQGFLTALKNEPFSFHLVNIFFSGLPISLYPFGGEAAYWKSYDEFGEETWYAPHNIWREVLHGVGGALLTIPFIWSIEACFWMNGLVFFGAFYNEVFIDAKNDGFNFKNICDIFGWTIGSFVVTTASLYLYN